MRNELNDMNVGGDLYKSGCVIDKIKSANENFLTKLQNFLGTSNSNNYEEVEITNYYSFFNDDIDHQEELEVDGGGCGGGINPPVAQTTMVNDTNGLNISWGNCCGGSILLNQPSFSFRSMTFPNMLSMWFCGDISKNIPPCRILRSKDVKHLKDGKQNISNIKYLVK